MKVLLVIDDEKAQEDLAEALSANGHEVITPFDWKLTKLVLNENKDFDWAIIDLPFEAPTNGYDVLREIARRRSRMKKCFVSILMDKEMEDSAKKCGATIAVSRSEMLNRLAESDVRLLKQGTTV